MSGRQVCDPNIDPDEWKDVPDARNDEDAVWHALKDYDPNEFDTGSPFYIHVRTNKNDRARRHEVRVIPTHFEVNGRGGL